MRYKQNLPRLQTDDRQLKTDNFFSGHHHPEKIAISFSVPSENPGFKQNKQLEIWFLGVGASAAGATLRQYLSQKRPRFLIISGFVGALDPQIQVGETFLCENVSDLSVIQLLLKKGWNPPPATKLYTAKKLAATAQEKAALYQATGMHLVDMESQHLFELAQSYSIPTITIRAVSDSATMDFPVPESILYDQHRQRPRPLALCTYLATNPKCIPGFFSLLKYIAQARARLKQDLQTLLHASLKAM